MEKKRKNDIESARRLMIAKAHEIIDDFAVALKKDATAKIDIASKDLTEKYLKTGNDIQGFANYMAAIIVFSVIEVSGKAAGEKVRELEF